MADSIVVNSKLDNKDFVAGTRELMNATKYLQQRIVEVSKQIQKSAIGYGTVMRENAVYARRATNEVERIDKEFQKLNREAEQFANKKIATSQYKELLDNISKTRQEQERLNQQRTMMEKLGRDVSSPYKNLLENITKTQTEIDQLNEKMIRNKELAKEVGKEIRTGKSASGKALNGQEIDDRKIFFGELAQEQDSLIAKSKQVQSDLSNLRREQQDMRSNGEWMSSPYKTLMYNITQARRELKNLKAEKRDLEQKGEGAAFVYGDSTVAGKAMQERIDNLAGAIDKAEEKKEELFKPPYLESWNNMTRLSGIVVEGFGRISNAAGMIGNAIRHPVETADRAFGALIQKTWQVTSSLAKMAGNAAIKFLKKLASTAVNAAIQLARLVGSAILSGLHRLAEGARNVAVSVANIGGKAVKSALGGLWQIARKGTKALTGMGKSARNSGDSFKSSLKTIIKYAFGVRSLFFLFRRLRTAVKEGLNEIAKKNPELKKALNSLTKSFNALKGSLATAFAPIVTAIAPALTYLINLLTTAINTIGAFFAALTGQKVYAKSVGGLDATGKSAKNASKNVKELERQLASFDDLDILKEKDSNSSSGSDGGFEYENTSIPDAVNDFIDRIKALFLEGNYEDIGKIIAEGLNKALQKVQDFIKWERIGDTVTKYMSVLTGAINGLIENFDWENLGATLGEGINTVVNTLRLWYQGIDWENLGSKIGEGINGLIARVDWRNIGNLLAERAHSVISILLGALTKIKWKDGGAAFAAAVNGLFDDETLWTDAGATVDRFLKGILDFTNKFVIDFNASKAGQDIRAALNEIDFDGIASDFWVLVKNAFTKAGSFANALLGGGGAGNLFGRVGSWITGENRTLWDDLADSLVDGFNTAVDKFIDWLGNASTEVTKIAFEFAKFLSRVFTGISWGKVGELIGSLFQTALSALGTFLAQAASDAQKVGDAVKDFIDVAINEKIDWDSDSDTSVASIIKNGLLTGIRALKGLFDPAVATKLGENIRSTLSAIPWSTIASEAWDAAKKAFNAAGSFIEALLGISNTKTLTISPLQSVTIKTDTDKNIYDRIYEIAKKLGEYLAKIPWKDIFEEAKKVIGEALSGMIDGLFSSKDGTFITKIIAALAILKLILPGKFAALQTVLVASIAAITVAVGAEIANLIEEFNKLNQIQKEGKKNAENSFRSSYEKNPEAAVQGYSQAYGVDLGVLGDNVNKLSEAVGAMYEAEAKGSDYVVAFGNYLKQTGMSLVDVQKAAGLSAEQLDVVARANNKTTKASKSLLETLFSSYAVNGASSVLNAYTKNKDYSASDDYAEAMINALQNNLFGEKTEESLEIIAKKLMGAEEEERSNNHSAWSDIGNALSYVSPFFARSAYAEEEEVNLLEYWGKYNKDNSEQLKKTNKITKNLSETLADTIYQKQYNSAVFGTNTQEGFNKDWEEFISGDASVDVAVNYKPAGVNGYVNNLAGYLTSVFAPGTDTDARVSLVKSGWTTIAEFVGTLVEVITNLAKGNWTSIGGFVGTLVSVITNLLKGNWSSIGGFVGTLVEVITNLFKGNWTSIGGFVGNLVEVITDLRKGNWSSIGSFVGNLVEVITNLTKGNWSSISSFIGTLVSVVTNLSKGNWTSIGGFVGTLVNVLTTLGKQGWTSIERFVGTSTDVGVELYEGNFNTISDFVGTWTEVGVYLARKGFSVGLLKFLTGNDQGNVTVNVGISGAMKDLANALIRAAGRAAGGIYSNGVWRDIPQYAGGAIMRNGRASWWDSINKYASGSSHAHGTLFAAGEAGPEVVGHIGGRTEVLNKSQLASTMYSAVANGMLAALSRVTFKMPAMATGSVLPYDVVAAIERTGENIQNTLNANNEDLIQTLISVAGQLLSAVNGIQSNVRQNNSIYPMNSQSVINELNRQTQMFGASPLKGV